MTVVPFMSSPLTSRQQVEQLLAAGFQLVFYPADTKGPKDKDWPARPYTLADYRDGLNVGIKTGVPFAPGLHFADVDVDWVGCPPSLLHRLLPDTSFQFGRHSKPLSHLGYLTSEPVVTKQYRNLDSSMLLELRGTSEEGVPMQTMVPPSTHPETGEPVRFSCAGAPRHIADLVEVTDSLAITMLLSYHLGPRAVLHDVRLALAGFLLTEGLHEQTVSAILTSLTEVTGNDVHDAAEVVKTTAAKLANKNRRVAGRKKFVEALTANDINGVAIADRISQWLGRSPFVMANNRIAAGSPANIRTALGLMSVELAYDAFTRHTIVRQPGSVQQLTDAATDRLWLAIEERFHFLSPRQLFESVVNDLAHQNEVHPVREYLDGLSWDGTPRLDTWLHTYCQSADSDYTRAVGRLVLVAAVRRIRRPGCKFDEMLVMESSAQGLEKSSLLRALCPKSSWFSDDLPLHLDSKQIIERTAGKWLIEGADLHGLSRANVDHLKSVLSRQVDGPVRMAYGRRSEEVPRQFVVIGTTNSLKYLKDTTGNRRFWPVRVGQCDVAAMTRDRDQLWAEAATRETDGMSIRLDPTLYTYAATQQDRRRLEDPWESLLVSAFEDDKDRLTTTELWATIGVPAERRDERGAERIARIMESLGFEHRKARVPGDRASRPLMRWCRRIQLTLEDAQDS